MCGIVGVINPTTLAHEKWFTQALIVDQLRGFHSTGAFAVFKDEVQWHKDAVLGTHFVEQEGFKGLLRTRSPLAYVGHNRWATMGEVNEDNAHPFHHNPITLVHNGTLRTEAPGVSATQFGTDSEGIAYALSQPDAVPDNVLNELSGAFVLVWHDLDDNCLRMARNDERTLYVAKCKGHDTLLFASEALMIEWLAARNNIELEARPYALLSGQLYRFDLNKTVPAERIRPYIKKLNLKPKYSSTAWEYSDYYWGRSKKKKNNYMPPASSAVVHQLPAPTKPPRESTLDDKERDEFLAHHKMELGEEIVCSVLDVTLAANNTFTVDAVYDTYTDAGEPDVVVYNVRAPLSHKHALDSATYICGKVVGVRNIDGHPTVVLNPSTVWIADSKWDTIYSAVDSQITKKSTGKKEAVSGGLRGPGGTYVSDARWNDLTSCGCSACGTKFDRREAELIEWIGTRPLCHHCSVDDGVVARLAVKH